MNPLTQSKPRTILPLLIALGFGCVALLPSVQAAPDPAAPPGNNTRDGAGSMASITTGLGNTAFGSNALNKLTTGNNNNAQGNGALQNLTTGGGNAAIGSLALQKLQTGIHNTAVGNTALNALTDGVRNTALGYGTLRSGDFSDTTAVGWAALLNNTANGNTAVGSAALFSNTVGGSNTAVGFQALFSNIGDPVAFVGGNANTAIGNHALFSNTLGSGNTAIGPGALSSNTEGIDNTAIGPNALNSNTIGLRNTAIGRGALGNALAGASDNIALGDLAGLNVEGASGNIHIGSQGTSTDSHVIRIGSTLAGGHTATFIAGISGAAAAGGTAVSVTAAGKLGTVTSSARFKDAIKPMDKASEAILALKPVTFHYKKELDPEGIPQFGLIAEDVAEVNPALVGRDGEGKIFSVRYEAVNAMLLNEFLKEHRTVQEQQKEIDALKAELKEQRALIQKVSDKVELSRPAPQVAENNR
jgi:hypothetical protein